MYNSIIVFRTNSIFRNDWRSTSQISYDRLITENGNSTLDKNTGHGLRDSQASTKYLGLWRTVQIVVKTT